MSSFSLLLSLLLTCIFFHPSHCTPAIYWQTTPTEHNQTVLLAGSDLDHISQVLLYHDINCTIAVNGSAKILDSWQYSLKFTLPEACFTTPPCYARLVGAETLAPIAVNNVDIWWMYGDYDDVIASSYLRVFGRGLAWMRNPDGFYSCGPANNRQAVAETVLVVGSFYRVQAQAATCWEAKFDFSSIPLGRNK